MRREAPEAGPLRFSFEELPRALCDSPDSFLSRQRFDYRQDFVGYRSKHTDIGPELPAERQPVAPPEMVLPIYDREPLGSGGMCIRAGTAGFEAEDLPRL